MPDDWKTVVAGGLIESVPTLLILLGACLLVLGLAGGITFHQWLPIAEVWARIGAGTVGALILGLGFFSWTRRCSLPKSRNYRIEINYPTKNDEVDTFDVKGTIKKALPENYTLRVLRVYSENRVAPTGGEGWVDPEKGIWEVTGCNMGTIARKGEQRDFAVYLVGPSGKALLDYFGDAGRVHKLAMDKLQKAGIETEYLPAIRKHTPDMIECCRLSLRKKS